MTTDRVEKKMTISFKYVPILQTKQNEYAALSELQANIKQHVKPLFSLTNSDKERRAQVLPKQIFDIGFFKEMLSL